MRRSREAPARPRLPRASLEPLAVPRPHRLTLDNGLRVLCVEQHQLPLVHLVLVVHAGHAEDPAEQPGVAFATAAMVDEGAGPRSALAISEALQEIGSSLNIVVDADATTLSLEVLRPHLDRALDLLADVVLRPHLAVEELDRVKGELVQRGVERRSEPTQVANLVLSTAVFGDHPYARPGLPLPADVARIRRAQVARFHRGRYRPDNALLVAAGDIGPKELGSLLARRFGRWRPGVLPRRPRCRPPRTGPRLVLVEREGAPETVLRVGHLLPRRRALPHAEVELLNTILGGSFTSRLNRNLRERHGFTYGVGSSFGLMREHGLLTVATQVETGVTVAALTEILRELAHLAGKPVGQREISKARSLVVEQLPEQAETLGGLVGIYAELATFGQPLTTISDLPVRLAALEPATLLATARRVLRPDAATLVVVGDLSRLSAVLERTFGPALRRDTEGREL